MTMLGEGLKDTCPVCATTTATEACPSSLHPSTAPTRGVLRLAVAICCCKEDKSSLTSTSGSANNARLFRRRHVYRMAIQYGILWQAFRELSSFRGRRSNSGRAHDGPILPQACIKLAFLLCHHRSFFPPCTLPCGPHLPPSLPWLLGCSVAFSIPRTPYMAP